MTLGQLRVFVFVAVAERQHVTRAAEALNIAQSAVSASIAALEGRHGAKLFHRVGRRIELTEAGALFLAEARAVLARAESAELVLSELGELKRYASQIIGGYWLPRYLVDARRSYPGVAIRLSIGNTSQAAAAVRGGEARSLQTVAPTTTILARPFIEPDAVRAPSTPSLRIATMEVARRSSFKSAGSALKFLSTHAASTTRSTSKAISHRPMARSALLR
jgi:DNA-binding transcriptional LysR family regulator